MAHPLRTFVLSALVGLAAAAPASAQSLGTFSWRPPRKVEELMEKERVPGIFFFSIPYEVATDSITWNFAQPQVMRALKDGDFACCKLVITDMKSSRPWGSWQKLADEFGVGLATTIVVVSFDREVMAMISQVIKRDEFIVFLKRTTAAHKKRVKDTDDASTDLDQVEKWVGEQSWGDAIRRLKNVLEKEGRVAKKVQERAKALDEKVAKIGNERLAEAKKLIDAGKGEEAKPILEDLAGAFSKYEDIAKEAKELLKKVKG